MTEQAWQLPGEALEAKAGTFVEACREAPDHLVYFLLNVGDGDTQVLLLPRRPDRLGGEGASGDGDGQGPAQDDERRHARRAIVVDVATTKKLPQLLQALAGEGLIDLADGEPFPLVVGTHPHSDHLGGMPEFLGHFGDKVGQYWEPGYYHPSGAFVETMVQLEDHQTIRHVQPTSGTTCFIDAVKVTVLTPGIGLRGRFDTYGVAINDASLSLRVEFPATRVAREGAPDGTNENRNYLRLNKPWSLLLGADAQTTSWAQAAVDFPQLHREHNPALYRALRAAAGPDPLGAHILKVPHHASKRGINLELMERIKPRLTLISSVAGGGRYNFPHPVTVGAIREALEPSGARVEREPSADHELGIHCTGGRIGSMGDAHAAGSIAVLVPPKRGARLRVWRFGDAPRDPVDLGAARRLRRLQ